MAPERYGAQEGEPGARSSAIKGSLMVKRNYTAGALTPMAQQSTERNTYPCVITEMEDPRPIAKSTGTTVGVV